MMWDENKVDEAFDAFYEREGKWPMLADLGLKNNLPGEKPIRRLYGGIKNYYKYRGISDYKSNKWSKNNIDTAIDIFYSKFNKYPRKSDFCSKYNLPSHGTMTNIYGNITNYYISRNIPIDTSKKHFWNKETCLSAILKEVKRSNKTIMFSQEEINNLSLKNDKFPSGRTLSRYNLTLENIAIELGVKFIGKRKIQSNGENEVSSYIETIYNGRIERQNKKILNNKHIDIYLPGIKIGIEYNGNYWHSIKSKEPKDEIYHIGKTSLAKEKDVLLCHIFESEWQDKRQEMEQYLIQLVKNEVIHYKSKIGSIIELNNRFPLRYDNLKVIEITEPQLKTFGEHQCWDCGTTIYEVV